MSREVPETAAESSSSSSDRVRSYGGAVISNVRKCQEDLVGLFAFVAALYFLIHLNVYTAARRAQHFYDYESGRLLIVTLLTFVDTCAHALT